MWSSGSDTNGNPYVQRLNPPVAGRWGEADSVSGGIDAPNAPNQINGYVNLVQDSFTNPVRAGYSFGIADLLNGAPAPQPTTTTTSSTPFRSVTPARSTTATSSTPPVA